MSHPSPVVGAILAGGRASRFGGAPKGLAHVGGTRVIDRVAAALRAVPCDELLLVANTPDATSWLDDARVVPDVYPNLGALGGIHTALTYAAAPVLVVAWDMPFVPTSLLIALHDAVLAGAPAAVPEGQPLCACYGAGCREVATHLIESGERRASALAEAVGAIVVGTASYGDPGAMFMNVNTPADLAAAERSILRIP